MWGMKKNYLPYLITMGLLAGVLVPTTLLSVTMVPGIFIACIGIAAISTYFWGKFYGYFSLLISFFGLLWVTDYYGFDFLYFIIRYLSVLVVGIISITLEGRLLNIINEGREAKAALELEKAKAEQLANIVESSDDAIISKDLNSIIVSWNKGAERMFGYSAEEMVGKHITEIFPEDKKDEEVSIISRIKSGERIKHYETIRVNKEGKEFPVSVTISPIQDSKGIVIGASKIARDISERKEYENRIKESEERYRAFVKNSSEGIWRFELYKGVDINLPTDEQIRLIFENGYLAECNDAMAQMYGFEEGKQLRGVKLSEMMVESEENYEYLKSAIENNYRISEAQSVERDKNGNIKYFMNSLTGIVVNNQLVRGWGVQRDVTIKRLQAEELARSQERYQNFIENSDEGICRVEFKEPVPTNIDVKEQMNWILEKGYIAETNQTVIEIYKIEGVYNILNRPLIELTERTANDDKFLQYFIENNYNAVEYESVSKAQDGTLVYRSTSMKGILKDEKMVRAWVIQRDVTPQKTYAMEREKLLREATDARIEAELANLEKDRFLANLSHELRTPLVSILGYSSLLKDTTDVTELSNGIKIINRNALLQLDLIEDLLDISRIVSGKIKINKEMFTLGEVFQNGIDMLRPKALDKKLEITYHCDGLPVFADKKRVGQIFNNLLSNAIKFTDAGEVKVTCGKTEDSFWFSVKDTGVGIPKDSIPRLFKQFAQLDSSSTKKKQGLGLGLSIVKSLVDLHKGRVEVESEVGIGSEFKVIIPLDSEVSFNEEVELSDSFEGLNLLVIEDDVDTGNLVKAYLEKKAGKVEMRHSVKEALELLETTSFDLYVFDLAMPDEDGLSLIKKLRAKGDKTPAVALTAYVDYKELALRSGFDFFMCKPVKFEEFSVIRSMVKKAVI